jgi:hypothetical protein
MPMPMNLIQKMLTNKSLRHPELHTQHPHPARQPKEKTWFDMYLTKDGKQIDRTIYHEGTTYCSVDAGETYTLVVLGSSIPSNFHTNHISLEFSAEIKVRLQCIANAQLLVNEEKTITYTEANMYRQEIPLHIDATMPNCELVLRMDVVIANDAIRNLGTKALFIHGSHELIQHQFLRECQIATKLPKNISIMSVVPHPDLTYQFGFTIQGWNSGQKLPILQYQNKWPISIQQYIQAGTEPASVRGKIRKFSQYMRNEDNKKLPMWLLWLEKTYPEECYLIIEDECKLEIPWEMLELQGDYHYLGAEIKVVRWISNRVQDITIDLAVNNTTHQGSIISYLDSRLNNEETKAERAILQQLQIEECDDLNSLKRYFKKAGNLTNIGLIYIGAHGHAGNRLYLASQKIFAADQLILMDEHAYPRPLAFFNACESARLGQIGAFDNNSFVTTLLERIAQGYIGTLAEVGSQQASKIAHTFLSTAYNDPEIPIAAILQHIRQEAAQQLKHGYETLSDDDPAEKAIELTFIYTFLYVYYGNPLARLQLEPRTTVIDLQQHIEETSCNN